MTGFPAKIAITGGSGFVGTRLTPYLIEHGFQVLALSRGDLALDVEDLSKKIKGCHGVINLAGAPVLHRWTTSYKKVMEKSRIDLTRNLVAAMAMMDEKPAVFISTSATGIYADVGCHSEEENCFGTGFLSRLAQAWEQEAQGAKALGVRTLIFRFGVVLGPGGGPVGEMLLPFKFGLGGTIGTGKQAFSWIHLEDLMRAYLFVLTDESCAGVYNLVAPHPSTNAGMTRALGQALRRPTVLRLPPFLLKLKFAEGAEILTKGQSAVPKRLVDAGFSFTYSDIDAAMAACIA